MSRMTSSICVNNHNMARQQQAAATTASKPSHISTQTKATNTATTKASTCNQRTKVLTNFSIDSIIGPSEMVSKGRQSNEQQPENKLTGLLNCPPSLSSPVVKLETSAKTSLVESNSLSPEAIMAQTMMLFNNAQQAYKLAQIEAAPQTIQNAQALYSQSVGSHYKQLNQAATKTTPAPSKTRTCTSTSISTHRAKVLTNFSIDSIIGPYERELEIKHGNTNESRQVIATRLNFPASLPSAVAEPSAQISSLESNTMSQETLMAQTMMLINNSQLAYKLAEIEATPESKQAAAAANYSQPVSSHYEQPNQTKKYRPKNFQCPACRMAFSNNGQLKNHVRIHTGERPFSCNYLDCGKTFTRNEELTRHRLIHTGVRPHQCPHCSKSFGRKDHLKKHTRTHERKKSRKRFHVPSATVSTDYLASTQRDPQTALNVWQSFSDVVWWIK